MLIGQRVIKRDTYTRNTCIRVHPFDVNVFVQSQRKNVDARVEDTVVRA